MAIIGSGYMGSPELMNSGAGNLEIVPKNKGLSFYKFEFVCPNVQEVVVKINNSEPICLGNGYFATEHVDANIHSFIVVTPDIDFYWYGAY